ncbi:OmpA family protein [Microvirga tunisiensis]|uniref:OmpA family protein n=1 Tax=Pannonibacter tanglangensis TaxID=2750084 RepID=A0A7X5F0V0_9HYPH|nr:OmpA family protein [Pannonibacter sp. XCT-53]NBN77693.1 OmpA family protein [Pannonibacter sp. XCT-53]
MRAHARRARHEEDEESAFVSMTDMTVGFLFIMMILLAFFASQARETSTVPTSLYDDMVKQRDEQKARAESQAEKIRVLEEEIAALKSEIEEKDEEIADLREKLDRLKIADPLEEYLSQVAVARREVLERLRDAILVDFPDLKVELSEESDALRFQGEGLFASNSPKLTPEKSAIVSKLAERLDEILPCFTIGAASRFDVKCNPSFAMVEAVQIEGHTDTMGSDRRNRNLSAARANNTFFAMTKAADRVMQHQNLKGQPVLSVAAYGPDRPVTTNDTPEGRSTNRRIDLRFIMVTPPDTDAISGIRSALKAGGGQP